MGPGGADTRSAGHYLWWLVRRQQGRAAAGALWGTLWMLGLTVAPLVLQRALGAVLPRRVATGEVVAVGGADAGVIGRVMTMTGPGIGAVVTYGVVAVILFGVSPVLAAVVLVGVPLLAVTLGPVLRLLHRVESGYRERQGALTARTADIVVGLRVLRGVGGGGVMGARYAERSRGVLAAGLRVGEASSWVQALAVGLPAVFLAAVTWLAAGEAAAGRITAGQLVAVYS